MNRFFRNIFSSFHPSVRSWKLFLKYGLLMLIAILTFSVVHFNLPSEIKRLPPSECNLKRENKRILKQNYLDTSNVVETNFLVNNSKCRIPNVDIWNKEVSSILKNRSGQFVSRQENGTFSSLTFVRKQTIVINITLLNQYGLSLEAIDCCYQTISRVEQNLSSYNRSADMVFCFSNECHKMFSLVTTPISGFIKVTCKKKGFFWDTIIHTELHLVAIFEKSNTKIIKKIKFWRKSRSKARPPNVLLLGIDSTSRMNFRRWMPSTIKVLEMIGAVEMAGYTKVGENTFPNLVPLLSSYSVDEIVPICYKTRWTAQDGCPYIWKNFSAANYLTALVEDAQGNFHYTRTGFVFPPVDIYPRPWMLAAYNGSFSLPCIGSQRPHQVVLNYVTDLIELAESHRLPYFITSWLTDLTHNDMTALQNLDLTMKQTLLNLWEKGYLRNTLLLVMSDHGYHFLEIRKTRTGWLEDKLPALWIRLPDLVKQLKPTWDIALRQNSRELTSPFDVHATIQEILSSRLNVTSNSVRGQSLFRQIQHRTCEEAGIPVQYCACGSLREFNGEYRELQTAANIVIGKINSELPSQICLKLRLGDITGAAVYDHPGSLPLIIIGIRTVPEDIELEAVLKYNATTNGKWEVVNVLRTNKIRACELLSKGSTNLGDATYCQCSCY